MLSSLLPVVAAAAQTGTWLPFPAEAGICTPPLVTLEEEKGLAAEATTSFFVSVRSSLTPCLHRLASPLPLPTPHSTQHPVPRTQHQFCPVSSYTQHPAMPSLARLVDRTERDGLQD